jgi:ribose transport system permease protein
MKGVLLVENRSLRKIIHSSFIEGVIIFLKRNMGLLIGLLIICVFISIMSPIFLSQRNIMNVLRQISSNMYLATSMTIILISGGIDLSVGSGISIIGVIAATLLVSGVSVILVVLICLLAGALIGAVNGTIISTTNLPPFIVTFSMMSILRGISYVSTGAATIRIDNKNFIAIGTGYLGPIPLPVVYMLGILFGVFLLLNKSALGRHIYAIGGNEKAAIYSGIRVKQIRLFAYIFSGIMAAVAGITLAARSYSGNPVFGTGAEMDAIAATVLGGVSMLGGSGYIGGTFIGALIIGILNNGLNLIGVDSFYQSILKGIVILVAVYVDYLKILKKTVVK